jgi:hypothetical protein
MMLMLVTLMITKDAKPGRDKKVLPSEIMTKI